MFGCSYMWFRGNLEILASRLDRFFLSAEVVSLVNNLRLSMLLRGLSNHNPILLKEESLSGGKRPFKWFLHWADDADFVGMVDYVLRQPKNRHISHALREIKGVIKGWVADTQ
ncbi:hypothetical protein V6N13_133701 [Hibiscus sabdariffa]